MGYLITIDEYRRDPDKRAVRFVQVSGWPDKGPDAKVEILTVYSKDSTGHVVTKSRPTKIKVKTLAKWQIVTKAEIEHLTGMVLP